MAEMTRLMMIVKRRRRRFKKLVTVMRRVTLKEKRNHQKRRKKGTKKSKKETTITMDTAKPKGGKWQATLKIQEGSSNLTVKMPFNKSNSLSEGAELKLEDGEDKKQKITKMCNKARMIKRKANVEMKWR